MLTSNHLFDLIIIGCGAAGIGAALQLQKYRSTTRFIILEARNRVGGRAFTDTQTFGAKAPVDLGARWLHHYHPDNPFYTYYFPSDKDRIDNDTYDRLKTSTFDVDGTPIPLDSIDTADGFFKQYCTIIENYPSNKEDVSIFDVIRDEYAKIESEKIRRLVGMCFASIEDHEGANLTEISTKSYGIGEGNIDAPILLISDGLGSFIKQIVDQNNLPIEFNTVVTQIEISNELNGLVHISTSNGGHYACKYVLVTIPLGCLKTHSVAFMPPIPDWKQTAIDKMGFGLLNKVFLQFSSIFWDENLQNIDVITNHYYQFYVCVPEACILVLYIAASHARELEQHSDQEIVKTLVTSLRRIYPLMTDPIKWLVTRWMCDSYSCGSYSYFAVGTDLETVKDLARESHHGRVHWAGEHTNYSGSIGYVDSAFESGRREATHILEKLEQS
ncbi:unnamed protein product [Rotaria sp. Silwood2]|nr:unnamed protein product [Rotaria sp. Silwood2]CAF2954997.1 unnamed protein product [Rotaria sp. Silwood2]CAF3326344.1 unnamed protein product [Rotaria sp. Silwood2]CAF4166777.1 unnamed protein product [Rotaria sp. Silwood2]CAF4217024.1 unnamed protein product [Rotaria sp. Silwood2]